jgi:hypothetical protein
MWVVEMVVQKDNWWESPPVDVMAVSLALSMADLLDVTMVVVQAAELVVD